MVRYILGVLQIFGIVFLRFKTVPRIWNIWLVGVNLACFYFIAHLEAQIVLATTLISVLLQAGFYYRTGFTRIMGIAHFLWLPMFVWLATRTEDIQIHPDLELWLIILLGTNIVSLIIDCIDVTRYVLGERSPHYCWR